MSAPLLSPLLAKLARAVAADGEPPRIEPTQWQAMLALAERHRVIALLAARCADMALPDARIASILAQKRLQNHALDRRNAEALAEIAHALRSAGQWFLVLKGTSVSARFYDQPADRNAIDIDILVEEAALGEVIPRIERLGFARVGAMAVGDGPPTPEQRAAAADIPFVRARDRAKLELHWRLSRNRHLPLWTTEQIKPHVVDYAASDGSLPVLTPPALLFYLTCHGSRHLWFRLKWLADIDRLVRAIPLSELRGTAKLARGYGCARLFHTSLDLARICFATPVDELVDPTESHPVLLRDMLWALEDQIAVRERYTPKDLRTALYKARGRFLLRPDRAYRRELTRHILVDVDDIAPDRPAWRAAAAKLARKLGAAR